MLISCACYGEVQLINDWNEKTMNISYYYMIRIFIYFCIYNVESLKILHIEDKIIKYNTVLFYLSK